MEHAHLVCGLERGADREQDIDDRARAERRLACDLLRECLAFEELHDEIGNPIDRSDVGDVDDVRMLDARGRTSFAEEALDERRVLGESRVENLDRDALLEARVERLVHDAHPSGAKSAPKLVLADPLYRRHPSRRSPRDRKSVV